MTPLEANRRLAAEKEYERRRRESAEQGVDMRARSATKAIKKNSFLAMLRRTKGGK